MKKQILTILLLIGVCNALMVRAAEVEGVKLMDKVRISESGPELVLNGAGVRTRMVFKVYVGALYLPQKRTTVEAVLGDNSARRVALHMLRDVGADQLFSALNDGLKNNNAPDQLAKIDAQIKQLEGIFAKAKAVKSGDVILLDYAPGAGTRVTVNGEAKGTIVSDEFNAALLRIWLGDKPAEASLKRAMLGG